MILLDPELWGVEIVGRVGPDDVHRRALPRISADLRQIELPGRELSQRGIEGLVVNTGHEWQKRVPGANLARDLAGAHHVERVGGIQRAVPSRWIPEVDAQT